LADPDATAGRHLSHPTYPSHHSQQCWGCFLPEGDSTLFGEVAGRIASVINECGFDFTYLDGLDGAHVIAGEENRWHYGARFAFEIFRRCRRPTMMEMATFHHHLWFVRSRLQAWDHAVCGHKKFIDLHCFSNEGCRRIFMPRHLGWSRVLAWIDSTHDVTFDDEVEYMWGKGLGTDSGYSLQEVTPDIWYNQVPLHRNVTCYLSPIKTLPVIKNKISKPAITVAGRSIVFPVEIESGCYLEFTSQDDCRLYGPKRELLQPVKPEGAIPALQPGLNDLTFRCDNSVSSPRAHVTVITHGDPPLRR
jgi:hypothetical protein